MLAVGLSLEAQVPDQIYRGVSSIESNSPSPPLGAERVGVRWGIPENLINKRFSGSSHLTLPIACAMGPLPFPHFMAERAIHTGHLGCEISHG